MKLIDLLIHRIGAIVSWTSLLLVIVIVADVTLRYLFSITSAASFELEWHLFAILFLIGAAYTLQEDKHVRVDVFYHRYSQKRKAWVNLIGTSVLLLPFCVVTFWESLSFVEASYQLNETSPDPGGLPFRYLIKSLIPVSFLLLFLAGISSGLKALKTIKANG